MENKIAFFEVKPWEKEYLQKHFSDAVFVVEKLSAENADIASDAQIISVFVDSQINKEVLEKLLKVKMITTRSTGYDQIDIEECKKRNIIVCNVPFYGENTVAEHTFALILDLSRKIHQSIASVKEWGFSINGLTGFDLKGKTIGIIGIGRIGQHVARMANGFEMKVIVCDSFEDEKLAEKLGFTYMALEELLKNSDIITLHLPYNKNTHHLINAKNINLIKKGAYLINTARGGIIETDALVKALEEKILAGAGLDVLEEEGFFKEEVHLLSKVFPGNINFKTMLENHVLMERENVIITPHNAFNSKEALERILETTVENINSFLHKTPINHV